LAALYLPLQIKRADGPHFGSQPNTTSSSQIKQKYLDLEMRKRKVEALSEHSLMTDVAALRVKRIEAKSS
jgi:hypothetical protein